MRYFSAAVLLVCVGAALAAPPFNPRTRVCEMAVVARDHFTRLPEHFYQCKDTTTAEEIDLIFPADGHKDILTGDIADVQGDDNGITMNVRGYTMRSRPSPPGRGRRALTTRSAMVLVLRFQDTTTGAFVGAALDTTAERTAIANTVNNTLFGVYDSAVKPTHAGMWNDCSFGSVSLGHDTDGIPNDFAADYAGSNSDIFYVDVPMTCTAGSGYCSRTYATATTCSTNEYYGWPEYALNYLTATRAGFNRNLWQHKVVIFPNGAGISCNWVGMGNVGCSSTYCYVWIPPNYANALQDYSHEMGHNLGLAHSGFANTTDANTQEYGDWSCAMGFCCSTRCYNAPHAAELGWVTPILSLSSANIANQQTMTQVLNSLSVSNRGAISINCDWCTTPTKYWVQLKTADNYDRFGTTSWLNNVQIKRMNSNGMRADHIWTGVGGNKWSEPSGLLHVTVNSIDLTAKTASITIKRGSLNPCDTVVCTALTQCHNAGTCDPLTGLCSNPAKADGSACSDGKSCTTEMCVAGTCTVQSTLANCCGNAKCETGETCTSCAADCGTCPCLTTGKACSLSSQCCSNKCSRKLCA